MRCEWDVVSGVQSTKDTVRVSGRSKKSICSDFSLADSSCASIVDESENRERTCKNQNCL